MRSFDFSRLSKWNPTDKYSKITTIDAHTAGEPLRIITGGYSELSGNTILAKRRQLIEKYDQLRTALMWEPRGHADMYGCLITPPVTDTADFGVLFMHNEGYSSMCGHGIIAVTTVALETGMIRPTGNETEIKIDSPAGLITAFGRIEQDKVVSVRFQNVPSFVESLDNIIEVPEIGTIKYDIAFGGAYYAFVDVNDVGLTCREKDHDDLVRAGKLIKKAVMADHPLKHPYEQDLGFLYGTIFIGEARDPENHSANVCVFAEGEIDRSPTGTGVSARMALHYARTQVAIGEEIIIESILGTTMSGKILREESFGPYQAVIPEVSSSASITGRHEFLIDPDDPVKNGFIFR